MKTMQKEKREVIINGKPSFDNMRKEDLDLLVGNLEIIITEYFTNKRAKKPP